MNRRITYTAAGIILSFTIAIGGWAIATRLIDMESERLLSAITHFSVDIPVAEPLIVNIENGDPDIHFGLTDDEIVSILQNWELSQYRRPHEPAPGQIDMNTAIIVGRMGVSFLVEQNILPADSVTFDNTGAFLSQNVPRAERFLPLRYSYWTVFFGSNDLAVNMTINAVTGQIWEIELTTRQWRSVEPVRPFSLSISRDDIEDTLAVFMSNLDILPVDGTMHGLLYSFDFEFDESGWPRLGGDPNPPVLFPPPGYHIVDEIFEMFRWMWYFESGLMLGQSFAEGRARAEIVAGGGLPGGVLYYDRLHIRLTASPQPESWFNFD